MRGCDDAQHGPRTAKGGKPPDHMRGVPPRPEDTIPLRCYLRGKVGTRWGANNGRKMESTILAITIKYQQERHIACLRFVHCPCPTLSKVLWEATCAITGR